MPNGQTLPVSKFPNVLRPIITPSTIKIILSADIFIEFFYIRM